MQDEMRTKCEQVVMECLRKIFEIVVQSRVHFQPERGAKNTTPQRPRVRAELTSTAIAKRCVAALLRCSPPPPPPPSLALCSHRRAAV